MKYFINLTIKDVGILNKGFTTYYIPNTLVFGVIQPISLNNIPRPEEDVYYIVPDFTRDKYKDRTDLISLAYGSIFLRNSKGKTIATRGFMITELMIATVAVIASIAAITYALHLLLN